MPLTVEQGKALITEFCTIYPVALDTAYKIRLTQEELYGQAATKQNVGTLLGGYEPGTFDRGVFRRGIASFATSNFCDESHFEFVIRHEILGHFGINTFVADEKRSLLNSIVEGRTGLSILWENVDKLYPKSSKLEKAEEVYSFAAELIEPNQQANKTIGERIFREICIERSRTMAMNDLKYITEMVSEGLKDRTRTQKNFPANKSQFKIDDQKIRFRKTKLI